jgi:hypothetical protein
MSFVSSADFISSEILAVLYIGLVVFVVITRKGSFHLQTKSLRLFSWAEIVLGISRAVYVAVPSTLTGGDVPTDLNTRESLEYWLNFVTFLLFLCGNCAALAAWLVIIDTWLRSLRVARNLTFSIDVLALGLRCALVTFALFEVALAVAYFFAPFEKLVMAYSIVSTTYSIALVAAFMFAGTRMLLMLRAFSIAAASSEGIIGSTSVFGRAIDDEQWSDIESSSNQLAPLLPLAGSGPGPGLANATIISPMQVSSSSDTSSLSLQAVNLPTKRSRITLVATVCTACSLIKACVESYQCAMMISPGNEPLAGSWWWLVTFLYFCCSEILPGWLVLFALRKQSSTILGAGAAILDQRVFSERHEPLFVDDSTNNPALILYS